MQFSQVKRFSLTSSQGTEGGIARNAMAKATASDLRSLAHHFVAINTCRIHGDHGTDAQDCYASFYFYVHCCFPHSDYKAVLKGLRGV
jgi:hypothetical protein